MGSNPLKTKPTGKKMAKKKPNPAKLARRLEKRAAIKAAARKANASQ